MTESNEFIKQQFGKSAKNYVFSPIHSSQEDLDFAISIINPFARDMVKWTVLDVGTGTGHLAFSLARYVSLVLATDITKEMLDELKQQKEKRTIYNVTIKEADVHNLPYPDNSFNMVTTRMAPHHFHTIEQAVKEMVRVTQPGGLIFIEDTISPENDDAAKFLHKIEVLRDPSHQKDLSVSEWRNLFEKFGCPQLQAEVKRKHWQLTSWTERIGTSAENVTKIRELLDSASELVRHTLQITEENGDYIIQPNNGYLLFQKP